MVTNRLPLFKIDVFSKQNFRTELKMLAPHAVIKQVIVVQFLKAVVLLVSVHLDQHSTELFLNLAIDSRYVKG